MGSYFRFHPRFLTHLQSSEIIVCSNVAFQKVPEAGRIRHFRAWVQVVHGCIHRKLRLLQCWQRFVARIFPIRTPQQWPRSHRIAWMAPWDLIAAKYAPRRKRRPRGQKATGIRFVNCSDQVVSTGIAPRLSRPIPVGQSERRNVAR